MSLVDHVAVLIRRRIRASGVVQGVGFRPYVHALAAREQLSGHVGNDAAGVFIEVEGPAPRVARFIDRLPSELPPLAQLDALEIEDCDVRGDAGFRIVESTASAGRRTLVPPDVATCEDCLAELDDPEDRRYRYPFVNCTHCGPRFTIIRSLPYDRPATTMADFELCPACAAEYSDPADRRYHAQPVACPDCGPSVRLETKDGDPLVGADAVVAGIHQIVADGGIVAVKGIGGYHLACDATNAAAVELLRRRKGRSDKPFAVMAPDLDAVERIARPTAIERSGLTDPARPIVLLRRVEHSTVSEPVAPGSPLVGVMLPYTPLHHLLFRQVPGAEVAPPALLVLTSGNRSDEPICIDDADARTRLADLADAWCTHDRPIVVPCDDSVVREVSGELQPIRRSRGYAPVPVRLGFEAPPVLGVGGELKNTCCLASGRHAWVSQHLGDMENLATLDVFLGGVDAFTDMYDVAPEVIAVDRHPGSLTRRWALARTAEAADGPRLVEVQHHHAHIASVMAEHGLGLDDEVLGFAFDGTGFGTDAAGASQIWGGEVLAARLAHFERLAHLAPLPLPGGDEAVRNPCRIALGWATALDLPLGVDSPAVAACDEVERRVVPQQVRRGVGCVPTTSIGRLFDVVSSLIGVRHRVTYEAQAAIELEYLAERGEAGRAPLSFSLLEPDADQSDRSLVIDPRPVLAGIVAQQRAGVAAADLAAGFHVAIAEVVATLARRLGGGRPIALSGGTFQNAVLTGLVRDRLSDHDVLHHRLVPPNDGGLSLGQAAVAAARHAGGHAPDQNGHHAHDPHREGST